MASQGPLYAGAPAGNLSNAGTSENSDLWINFGNIVSDNGAEASITAATYDSPDISAILRGYGWGFSIPSGATIDGIVIEIERRCSAGSANDFRVQLAKGITFADLVGSNKATAGWPSFATVATYGGPTDLWGTTWTPADINSGTFAVFLSVQAAAANTDIHVDFMRATVYYTEGASPTTFTPAAVAIDLNPVAPVVSTSLSLAPAAVAIDFNPVAPTVTTITDTTLAPDPVALDVNPVAPALGLTLALAPAAVALDVNPVAPALGLTVALAPDPVAFDLNPVAPAVSTISETTFAPDPVALDVNPVSPTFATSLALTPAAVSFDVNPVAPALATSLALAPAPVALDVNPVAPTVSVVSTTTFSPDPVVMDVNPVAPALGLTVVFAPDAVAMTLAAPTPSVSVAQVFAPDPVVLTLGPVGPVLVYDVVFAPNPVAFTMALPNSIFRSEVRVITNPFAPVEGRRYPWLGRGLRPRRGA